MESWMEPFARTIDAAKKYVVSRTLDHVDWNAKLVRGDLGKAIQPLKQEPGKGLFMGSVTLPLALAGLELSQQRKLRQLVEELKTPGLVQSRYDEILDVILANIK